MWNGEKIFLLKIFLAISPFFSKININHPNNNEKSSSLRDISLFDSNTQWKRDEKHLNSYFEATERNPINSNQIYIFFVCLIHLNFNMEMNDGITACDNERIAWIVKHQICRHNTSNKIFQAFHWNSSYSLQINFTSNWNRNFQIIDF